MVRLPDLTADTPSIPALRLAFTSLDDQSAPRWGRMRAAQMIKHCRVFVELCLGRVAVAWPVRSLARLFGPLLLRRMLAKSPTEAPKNLGTLPPLRANDSEHLDIELERERLFAAFDEIEALPDRHRHPLYGVMRTADVVALVRHHTSHHANQFGLLAQ